MVCKEIARKRKKNPFFLGLCVLAIECSTNILGLRPMVLVRYPWRSPEAQLENIYVCVMISRSYIDILHRKKLTSPMISSSFFDSNSVVQSSQQILFLMP
jgi:hypothetical protein